MPAYITHSSRQVACLTLGRMHPQLVHTHYVTQEVLVPTERLFRLASSAVLLQFWRCSFIVW